MPQQTEMLELIRGAVARGWCTGPNSFKTFDITLAEAITEEVRRLVEAHAPATPATPDLLKQGKGERK